MIRYIVYVDGEKTQEGDLAPGEHIVGRSRSADIHLSQPDISGKHLMLAVSEDGVFAENLSSHGTLYNGSALESRTELRDGDKLGMGKHLVFELALKTSAPAEAENPEATAAPSGETVSVDPDKTLIPGATPVPVSAPDPAPAAPADDDPDKTLIPGSAPVPVPGPPVEAAAPAASQNVQEELPDVQKTDVMHTRLASFEEMEHLRHVDRKRSTGKTLKYLLVTLAAVAALALLYSLKTAPRENILTWPVDSNGRELGAFYDPGTGGHKAGSFSLTYPNIEGVTTIETKKGGAITVNTRCGRDASVPLRIMFISRKSDAYLAQDRKAVMADMLSHLQKNNGRWNLAQISDVFFIGSDNGLPCLSVEYRREADKQSWYGTILFFRTGAQGYMRLAEIPAAETGRGLSFVSNITFLRLSPQYVKRHWEGNPEYRYDGDAAAMMNEVSKHLSKQAPFEWPRTYLLLQQVLMESVRRNDAALKKNALAQLNRLRGMQNVWYNSQKLQYNTAELNNDRHQRNAVMELCKTVFSSPDDHRYFTLRRNIWE